jgi:uncharacterized protein YndB with AHSA1/START domain
LSTTEPIRRRMTVACPADRAFEVFTMGMATWWPLETHSIAVDQELEQRATDVAVEPRAGGLVEEVLDDGSRRRWAEILVWDPPRRVVYGWKPNDLPTPPTELDVMFDADGGTTTVELEHRGWEGLGSHAEQLQPLYASEGGWTMVLERYRGAAEAARG